MPIVTHQRAKNHLVVPAERAPKSAAHPRFHKRRRAFMEPARRILPGTRQKAERDRDRVVDVGQNFASKDRPERGIAAAGFIADDDVRQLVIRHQADPFG
jgi:hypothetical protein